MSTDAAAGDSDPGARGTELRAESDELAVDDDAQSAPRRVQPVGEPIDFTVPPRPQARELQGRYVTLRALDPGHDAEALYGLTHEPAGDPSVWTYMLEGPYTAVGDYRAALAAHAASDDPVFFAICPNSGESAPASAAATVAAPASVATTSAAPASAAAPATGIAATSADGDTALGEISLMSIVPEHGTIELGNVLFSPLLQRTRAATECVVLLAREAFDELGYRRLEWKCNSLNAPSRRAAQRYGFQFEGIFAQHRVVKGRNRDTAWFAITDHRWPAVRAGFEAWLDPENFRADGRQQRTLASHIGHQYHKL
jgi:RimJ/RimL family protein N-acetyltransferase